MSEYTSVLLVEDDEVDVMNVCRAFRKKGFTQHLHLANDGIDAFQQLEHQKTQLSPYPDLILLDLNMPRMGGLEFLERLRTMEDLKHMDVVVMSTSFEEIDQEKARIYGVKGYIIKPLYTDQFADELAELLS